MGGGGDTDTIIDGIQATLYLSTTLLQPKIPTMGIFAAIQGRKDSCWNGPNLHPLLVIIICREMTCNSSAK